MTYVKQSLTLLSAQVGVGITENKSNGREEVTLARTIAADDNIVFGRKRLNDRLVLVAVAREGQQVIHWSCIADYAV